MALSAFATDRRLEGFSERTVAEDVRVLATVPFDLPGTVRQAKDWLAARALTVSAATIHRNVCSLKAYSRWWADENRADDPLAGLPYPKVPQAVPGRIADESELQRALRALGPHDDRPHPNDARDHAILSMFAYTGLRRSELVRIEMDDLDLEVRTLLLRLTKNGRPRTVPVHPKLGQSVHRYLKSARRASRHASSRYLFLGRKGPLRADSITRVFDRINRVAGTNLTSHQFRRRLAKTWIEGGGADDALMLIAGWTSLEMPARYRREAVEVLAREQYDRIYVTPAGRPRPGPKAARR